MRNLKEMGQKYIIAQVKANEPKDKLYRKQEEMRSGDLSEENTEEY